MQVSGKLGNGKSIIVLTLSSTAVLCWIGLAPICNASVGRAGKQVRFYECRLFAGLFLFAGYGGA